MPRAQRKRTKAEEGDAIDEPVFHPEPLPARDPAPEQPPVIKPVSSGTRKRAARATFDEPVFEAVPAQARGVTLPVDAPRGPLGWDAPAPDEPDPANVPPQTQEDEEPAEPLLARRLGRSVPRWVGLAVVAVVVLFLLTRLLPRNPTAGEFVPATLPAAGVVGSTLLNEPDVDAAAPEPTVLPTSTPSAPRLTPGMQVVVSDTNGQGIRLRAAPGTNSLTIGIYNDGAPFTVLTPGGDYSDYPVEVDGYFWYRIRVLEDPNSQLVGWAVGDFLASPDEP